MATINRLTRNITIALAAICLIGGSVSFPAMAMTLNGHLEASDSISSAGNGGASGASPNQGNPQVAPQVAAPVANSFPAAYQGTWACKTTVVDSSAPAVIAGQMIDSEVTFYPTAGGRIQARWNQAGWVETQSSASCYGKDNNEAKSDRTTYFYGDNSQGSWAARSRDQFALTAPDTINAKSYVDQYIDGQYAGRYRTVSVLTRTGVDPTIAANQ